MSVFPTSQIFTLRPKPFINTLHLRFGATASHDIVCVCKAKIARGKTLHHFVGCKLAGSVLTERHELVKNAIASVFRQGGATVAAVGIGNDLGKRPDLLIRSSRGETCIDVSIVHPLAPSHIGGDPIHKKEQEKMVKYSAQAAAEEQRFIPAVLDTFGKHGPGLGKLVGLSRTSAASQTPSPTSAYNSSSASQWRF